MYMHATTIFYSKASSSLKLITEFCIKLFGELFGEFYEADYIFKVLCHCLNYVGISGQFN